MTDIKIDNKAFEAEVRKLVAENPDKVYAIPEVWSDEAEGFVEGDSCVYVERDQDSGELCGSCLFGQVLVNLGVPAAELENGYVNKSSIGGLNRKLGLGLDDRYVSWASAAQRRQDDKMPWRDALAGADQHYPLPK